MKKKNGKRSIIFAVGLYMLISLLSVQYVFAKQPELSASAAVVLDVSSGEVLYSKNEADTQAPGGLTAYAKNHFETVFVAGCVFLSFMLVLIIVLLMRCMTNHKIRKKRREAEKEWLEKEAELEEMQRRDREAEAALFSDEEDGPPGFLR